jgi:hypothetical protein
MTIIRVFNNRELACGENQLLFHTVAAMSDQPNFLGFDTAKIGRVFSYSHCYHPSSKGEDVMADARPVAAIGDIEIDIDEHSPTSAIMRIPVVLQDGEEFVLALAMPEVRAIWEFLAALHAQKPAVFGIQ